MLSSSAFNAFLKTLEEPPPYAIFILATTEKHKILPTILSRCQIFDFKKITINDTVNHLQEICNKEEITAEKPALQIIAQKSEERRPCRVLPIDRENHNAIVADAQTGALRVLFNFLAIEAPVTNREKLRRLPALDRCDRDAIQVARVVKASVT